MPYAKKVSLRCCKFHNFVSLLIIYVPFSVAEKPSIYSTIRIDKMIFIDIYIVYFYIIYYIFIIFFLLLFIFIIIILYIFYYIIYLS